ncbi:glycosyl transferase group 1 protein [Arthrobacter crystallopoietes BAB-32]|uniref:Glycosyl transferase group 1 protein n=1 Tax=Arthrobacter crystallopoietes BAB-32 TaxID=1246476 RepID=N1V5F4_9MICC|nr:glycosyltransferase [Arthrobacter crystallopoietes]EMY35239.1 glycosyl transferase group 1 protein [Arthrobacter crystallopoietes BAB-32]
MSGTDSVARPLLPAMKYFMVLWGIADNFGGMTTMSLHRAGAFGEAGRSATVVTFDPKPSYEATTKRLRVQGKLAEDAKVVNVFQHYRTADAGSVGGPAPVKVPEDEGERGLPGVVLDPAGSIFSRTFLRPDGTTVAARHFYRPDGSEYLRDEAPQTTAGISKGRFLTLVDESGADVAQWRRAGDFYRFWMADLAAGQPAAFIVDSSFASSVVAPLERPNIIKLMVLHNSHISGGGNPFLGKLAAGQRRIHENSLAWDGLVFLTHKQRQDYEARFGTSSNLFTVSNPKPRAAALPDFAYRVPGRGVMVCRLEAQKNVPHAIDVMARVHQERPEVTLDIYGTGSLREELQEKIDLLGLRNVVRLHGHTPNAADQFETARFSLLTSRNEGQPLSLMESLGRGCPPIAYDIRYGPSDVIEDGVNGFLVPAQDVGAAAARTIQMCDDDDLARRMGEAAWERSERFSDEAVVAQWARTIEGAWNQRTDRLVLNDLDFRLSELFYTAAGGFGLAGDVVWSQQSGPPAENVLKANLVVGRRSGGAPAFYPMEIVGKGPGLLSLEAEMTADDIANGVPDDNNELDIFLQIHGNNVLKSVRIGFPGKSPSWKPFATAHAAMSLKLV